MEEEKKRQARAAALIEAGISEEEVEAKLETFASLSDEQFNDVVSTIAGLNEPGMGGSEVEEDSTDTDSQDETDASELESQEAAEAEAEAELEETDEEVLETASVEEEADLSVASEEEEEDPVEQTRAGLREWVDSYVFNQ